MEQREVDNMLLSMIQKHFPSLPLSDEHTDWGKWLGFARAVYEAGRASPASVPEVTDGMAIAFHNALTDGAIGQAEVDEIKTGLRAALAALAEQNERMRKVLLRLACLGNGDQYGNSIGNCIAQEALSLPDLATPVLNRIRAEGMRMAADICSEKHSLSGAEVAIRARAAELEKSNG